MLSEYSQKNIDLLLSDSKLFTKDKEFQKLYSFLQLHSYEIQNLTMNQTMKYGPYLERYLTQTTLSRKMLDSAG